MARRSHKSYYVVRARRHEKAARSAKSANQKAGHHEIASGYYKLARSKNRGSEYTRSGLGGRFGKKRTKKRHHKRSSKKGKRR